MSATSEARRCRECGCSEDHACTLVDYRGIRVAVCVWEEWDLCSACVAGASGFWRHPPRTRRARVGMALSRWWNAERRLRRA